MHPPEGGEGCSGEETQSLDMHCEQLRSKGGGEGRGRRRTCFEEEAREIHLQTYANWVFCYEVSCSLQQRLAVVTDVGKGGGTCGERLQDVILLQTCGAEIM